MRQNGGELRARRMRRIYSHSIRVSILAFACLQFPPALRADPAAENQLPPAAQVQTDYNRDVKPILQANCYSCHGPEKQKGGLRLDLKASAMKGGDSGPAILPGQSAKSLLIQNVARLKDATPMPPKGDPLKPEQIALLRAWIDQGAIWPEESAAQANPADHWAFKPPIRRAPPEIKNKQWPRNPLDNFILARLEKEGLQPSPEADRVTLIRRLSLDLIGLPPTPEEVDRFVADADPDAYEKLVDRLMASSHFGERWARHWLDAARYADTNGYEKDRDRSIWPYRDWVINAFNRDLPFDEFAIEQIAGDLFPKPKRDQIVATGFNRNTMVNEEGGVDYEEFRYESIVDRVKTTGTVFLGLTVQCAQCHNHKFDPISQKEYYGIFAFLNNADEPEIPVPSPQDSQNRLKALAKIAKLQSELESQFPTYDETSSWEVLTPSHYESKNGALLTKLADNSLLAFGHSPDQDTYQISVNTDLEDIAGFRIEVLTDSRLPKTGPGRADDGNFVLSEFKVIAGPKGNPLKTKAVTLQNAEADHSQEGYAVSAAIDGDLKTGWAIGNPNGPLNQNRHAEFRTKDRLQFPGGASLTFTLEQRLGGRHTLGHFRLSALKMSRTIPYPNLAQEEQRKKRLSEQMAEWEKGVAAKSRHWTVLDPASFVSENRATLTKLEDLSILASGDKPNKDIYDVEFHTDLKGITGLRLEVLPDPSLPISGPGRGTVVGMGNFMLSEFKGTAGPMEDAKTSATLAIKSATADFAQPGREPALTIDDNKETGWAIDGGQGKPHAVVYELKDKIAQEKGTRLNLSLVQYFIHQDTIGRFRISATTDPAPIQSSGVPAEIEEMILMSSDQRSEDQKAKLKQYFLSVTPELKEQNKKIEQARKSLPRFATTLAMAERADPRETRIHVRGEFLRTGDAVTPGVPAVLPPLPEGRPLNRMTFAQWLVDDKNPLVARVAVNRFWQAIFGRGIVATSEDFGTRGDLPSHPELLDWLATEFMYPAGGRPWSVKTLLRLLVTSATYRQSSKATPELLARDPQNILLARGSRFRVEAEMVRDIALSASGLLNPKIGGPSVYPPQPEGVTELAYGSPKWPASNGTDRYRRGLYTFWKRSAPYPSFMVFDAPSADMVCTRRVRSNTPLQALTMLNDSAYVEASQALAKRVLTQSFKTNSERVKFAFQLCLARQPEATELQKLLAFHDEETKRFGGNTGEAAKLALQDPSNPPKELDLKELAAWTAVSRVLLNLDETITKE